MIAGFFVHQEQKKFTELLDKLKRVNVITYKLCFILNFIFKLTVGMSMGVLLSDWLALKTGFNQCMSCCVGADPMKWNSPQQGWSLPRPLLGFVTVELIWLCSSGV